MKKLLVLLLLCLQVFWLPAQEVSWKDSVQVKKVTDAYGEGQLVYFRTKKGWGIWQRSEKKVVVQPVYQFLQADEKSGRIFFVQNNRVGLLDIKGALLEKPVYQRLGFASYFSETDLVIKNDAMYQTDSAGSFYSTYGQLMPFTEFSLAVHNGLVLVNRFERSEPFPLMVVGSDGMVYDSLDTNGNPVYMEPAQEQNSRVFDLATGTWLTEPWAKGAKLGCISQTLVSRSRQAEGGTNSDVYVVHNPRSGFNRHFRDPYASGQEKKFMLALLNEYEPRFFYCADTSQLSHVYTIESKGRYGLFDATGLRMLVEPQYDFVYMPAEASRVFTVKNGLVGLMDLQNEKLRYDNLYEQLQTHDMRLEDHLEVIVQCNATGFELQEGPVQMITMADLPEALARRHPSQGLGVWNGKIIITDYYPAYERQVWDDDIQGMAEVVPGKCYSGVFDPKSMKWTVPPQYTRVVPGSNGYACLNLCSGKILFGYYNNEGKARFDTLTVDSLRTHEEAQKLLCHATGKTKVAWIDRPNSFYGERAVVSDNNLYGVYDYASLSWKIPAVHQYMDYNALAGFYTVTDSGRAGLFNDRYEPIVPAQYSRLHYFCDENLVCANDTFLYAVDSFRLAGLADTLKTSSRYFGESALCVHHFMTRVEKNGLYTEEGYYDPELMEYDVNGFGILRVLDTARTNVTDITTGSRVMMPYGAALRVWDKGFITRDASGVYRAWDAAGKNAKKIADTDSIGCNGKWFWHYEPDNRYHYDLEGKIVKPTELDLRYTPHKYMPVGTSYRYFNGEEYLQGPAGFVVLCANQAGLLLGYEITTDARSQAYRKKLRYYDTGTKQYSDVELELGNAHHKVFPVKDGFVIFDYSYAEKQYACTVLDHDLKTVKSSFKKLVKYETAVPHRHLDGLPYYVLYTDKKIVYFDRHFQFMHECNYQDRPRLVRKYNRIILQSKFKSIVMDWQGRLISQ